MSLVELHEAIDRAGGVRVRRDPRTPEEIARGVPALQGAALDVGEAAALLRLMAESVLHAQVPAPVVAACQAVLREDARELVRTVAARGEPPATLGNFLAWKALARTVGAAGEARGSRCPTCGSAPAMARIAENTRTLACGMCGTRWAFKRVGCPYCDGDEPANVLEPEADEAFRIDVCRECRSYLKTYVGEGDSLALSDWSTLHLDAACAGRGLQRGGPSLYDL